MKKVLICAILSCITIVVMSLKISYASSSDIKGHWAENEIAKWEELKLLEGYDDGTFKPDNKITRAEYFTLLNRVFKFAKEEKVNFIDVSPDDWFAKDIAIAIGEGYVEGYDDNTVKPNNSITRQEVATAVSKILDLDVTLNTNSLIKFVDLGIIPDWSKGYLNAMVQNGFMDGYPDGTIRPSDYITRAETVSMLSRVMESDIYLEQNSGENSETETTETTQVAEVLINTKLLPGSVEGSVVISCSIGADSSIRYVKQSEDFDYPVLGQDASTIGEAYQIGSDILNAQAGEKIAVYEVDSNNKVLKFTYLTINEEDIAKEKVDGLTNLVLNDSSVFFIFDPNVLDYPGTMVGNEVSSIAVTPYATGSVKVNGQNVESGSNSQPIDLTVGVESKIIIEAGSKTYTLSVTRQAPQSGLTSLVINPNLSNFTFNASQISYVGLIADSSTDSITLTATGSGTIRVFANYETILELESGVESSPIQLKEGLNMISILIEEEGKLGKSYSIYITK